MKSSRALAAVLSCLLVLGLASAPPAAAAQRFTDVPANHTFASQIAWLADRGITTGYPNGTFQPSAPVLREQMAAFLHRFAGSPKVSGARGPFNDVSVDHTFARAINWMSSTRISTGYDAGRAGLLYRGSDAVLREQMAAFLYRAAGSPDVGVLPTTSPFIDVPTTHTFYAQVVWLAGTGITTGYANGDGTKSFSPSQPVLREQMAAFLFRFDDLIEREGNLNQSVVSVLPDGTVDRGNSTVPQVTGDGEYVAFTSETPFYDLDADFGFARDVFVKERSTGELYQAPDEVSRGLPSAGLSFETTNDPVISDDGSTVIYRGYPGDNYFGNSGAYAAIWDTESDSVGLLPTGGYVYAYDLTTDGREVVFSSRQDPETGAMLAGQRLFVWDRDTGAVSPLLTSTTGGQTIDAVQELAISADGRFVAFTSGATNLVADDTTTGSRIFVLDRHETGSGATRRVSLKSADATSAPDQGISLADDGSVAYTSQRPAPEIGDLTMTQDVRLWDASTGTTSLVSHNAQGEEGNSWSHEPEISADGQSIVFRTRASDVSGSTTVPSVIVVWDRESDDFTIIDQDYWGGPVNVTNPSLNPDISDDGSTIVYASDGRDLVPFNLIGHLDIYAWERPSNG